MLRTVAARITRVDSLEKVLEKLATTEKTTIAIAREVGGKVRVTSGSWEGEKVILKDQVVEVRNVDGREICEARRALDSFGHERPKRAALPESWESETCCEAPGRVSAAAVESGIRRTDERS